MIVSMKIHSELDKLTKSDIYSLLLFALYQTEKLPEYSTLSQLSYILTLDDLLKFLEFYGGLTIRVPKISELEELLFALLLFEKIDIEKELLTDQIAMLKEKGQDEDKIIELYKKIKEMLSKYDFNSGR